MDTFVEQLVVIKNDGKKKATKVALWVICSLLAAGLIVISVFNPGIAFLTLLLAAASFFCAYYFSGQLNTEFEYIITNKDIDIDCIINKKKRVRMASFHGSDIENIEKYNPRKHKADKSRNINAYFGCTPDKNTVALTVRHPKNGHYFLIISPNDEFKDALRKAVSYTLKNSI